METFSAVTTPEFIIRINEYADYQRLKRMRWICNRLAREVGTLDSELCTEADVDWIVDFRRKMLSVCDPLSVVRKEREEELKRQREARAQVSPHTTHREVSRRRKKESFFVKIKKLFFG